ncbi:hypothetical protein OA07_16570 [Aphanizomenon flos-aquae 2012/KM1/D3]|nr:hypothetical protein OA07_16570 [Aphanizomenon flos-aquae 2012/KM1/D3]
MKPIISKKPNPPAPFPTLAQRAEGWEGGFQSLSPLRGEVWRGVCLLKTFQTSPYKATVYTQVIESPLFLKLPLPNPPLAKGRELIFPVCPQSMGTNFSGLPPKHRGD